VKRARNGFNYMNLGISYEPRMDAQYAELATPATRSRILVDFFAKSY